MAIKNVQNMKYGLKIHNKYKAYNNISSVYYHDLLEKKGLPCSIQM